VFDIALVIRDRQQRGAVSFELAEVVITSFHFDLDLPGSYHLSNHALSLSPA
jgi:hypothetical protein